jgi:tetratricopeptide (TPR) repeat protein
MRFGWPKIFLAVCLASLFAAWAFADESDSTVPTTNAETVANGYLQIQAQLHDTQLQIEQSRREAAAEAQRNSDALNARLQALEQTIAMQRANDAETARRTQQFTLFLAGGFGLAGLGIMMLMGYFQWQAFAQLSEISARQSAVLAASNGVHHLAEPGRAMVETSNARLLDIVERLEKRIHELESGGLLLTAPAKMADPLAEGQKFLDEDAPEKALECFDALLASHPNNAEALVKKAAALDKLDRVDEALDYCDRAIAADDALVAAHLHKGGLLNRLHRYEEALGCYEQALLAQKKKSSLSHQETA